MDSLIFDTAIGLVFIFATFSLLVSVLTEGASRLIGLRGEYLLRGIRTLLDGKSEFKLSVTSDLFRRKHVAPAPKIGESTKPWVSKILNQPAIARSADNASVPKDAGNAKLTALERRQLPSYISGRSFARALIDLVVPSETGKTTLTELQATIKANVGDDDLKAQLLQLANEAEGDITKFRQGIEEWYDDHMSRVSGWYKRHARWISLGFGVLVVLAFNVNVIDMTRSLYSDQALRASVVSKATDAADCGGKEPAICLDEVRKQIGNARASGLPIGWGTVPRCAVDTGCAWTDRVGFTDPAGGFWSDFRNLLLVLIGWALMVLAMTPGARFWFDALSRLGSLRSSGPKPEPK